MKLKFLLLAILSIPAFTSMGQYENVWAFPHHEGLDFNGGAPVAIQSKMTGFGEASASVCDSMGQLLFYTEGDTLWNRNGEVTPNGAGLSSLPAIPGFPPLFPGYSATSSSVQGALIVPMPANPDKYYVFSMSSFESAKPGYMTYSVVDMSLAGGLGDVEPGLKAVPLDSNLTERMIGITGNDHNVWVLVAEQFPAGSGVAMGFKSYELTASGLNTTPQISTVQGLPPATQAGRMAGIFSVSPDRKKLALTRTWGTACELYDFDPQTGMVSNQLVLDSIAPSIGACFSPDGAKLYVYLPEGIQQPNPGIYQFDVSGNSVASIMASKTKVASLPSNMNGIHFKMAPDGKVYFHYLPLVGSQFPVIGAIQEPNVTGLACAVEDSVLVLASKNPYFPSLPNVVPAFKFRTVTLAGCPEDSTPIQAVDTNGYSYEWSDGATGPDRTAITSGTYWVRYHTMPYILNTDTFIFTMADLDPIITVDEYVLGTTQTYETYQWMLEGVPIPGADQSEYTVIENGDYQVIVSNAGGCVDTSAIYTVNNVGIGKLQGVAGQIRIYPNPASDYVCIQAPVGISASLSDFSGRTLVPCSEGERFVLEGVPAGVYFLRVFHQRDAVLLKTEKLVISR